MTEPKHDALYTAMRAHRDALADATGDLAEVAADIEASCEAIAVSPGRLRENAAKVRRVATEFAHGLEAFSRIINDAMLEDTVPIDHAVLAASEEDP